MIFSIHDESGESSENDISDYMISNLKDGLARVDGVGGVELFGAEYAMRIWLDPKKLKSYNLMVKNISEMIENLKMNTGVSEIMVFVKHLQKESEIGRDVWDGFLRVLSVFTPFVAEDLWQEFKSFSEWKPENSVHLQKWPEFDERYTHSNMVTIPIQINGKVRSEVEIDINDSEDTVKEKVLLDGRVKQHTTGKEIKKIIYIKGKIFNIVL